MGRLRSPLLPRAKSTHVHTARLACVHNAVQHQRALVVAAAAAKLDAATRASENTTERFYKRPQTVVSVMIVSPSALLVQSVRSRDASLEPPTA